MIALISGRHGFIGGSWELGLFLLQNYCINFLLRVTTIRKFKIGIYLLNLPHTSSQIELCYVLVRFEKWGNWSWQVTTETLDFGHAIINFETDEVFLFISWNWLPLHLSSKRFIGPNQGYIMLLAETSVLSSKRFVWNKLVYSN
jgi:hypothetical protein